MGRIGQRVLSILNAALLFFKLIQDQDLVAAGASHLITHEGLIKPLFAAVMVKKVLASRYPKNFAFVLKCIHTNHTLSDIEIVLGCCLLWISDMIEAVHQLLLLDLSTRDSSWSVHLNRAVAPYISVGVWLVSGLVVHPGACSSSSTSSHTAAEAVDNTPAYFNETSTEYYHENQWYQNILITLSVGISTIAHISIIFKVDLDNANIKVWIPRAAQIPNEKVKFYSASIFENYWSLGCSKHPAILRVSANGSIFYNVRATLYLSIFFLGHGYF